MSVYLHIMYGYNEDHPDDYDIYGECPEEANATRTTHARLNGVLDLVRTARRKRQKRDIFDNATDRIAELVGDRECTLEGCYGPGKGASWISKWTRVVMFNDGFMKLQGLADRYARFDLFHRFVWTYAHRKLNLRTPAYPSDGSISQTAIGRKRPRATYTPSAQRPSDADLALGTDLNLLPLAILKCIQRFVGKLQYGPDRLECATLHFFVGRTAPALVMCRIWHTSNTSWTHNGNYASYCAHRWVTIGKERFGRSDMFPGHAKALIKTSGIDTLKRVQEDGELVDAVAVGYGVKLPLNTHKQTAGGALHRVTIYSAGHQLDAKAFVRSHAYAKRLRAAWGGAKLAHTSFRGARGGGGVSHVRSTVIINN